MCGPRYSFFAKEPAFSVQWIAVLPSNVQFFDND